MSAGPLMLRELREQSRRPMLPWLRLAGAGVTLLGLLVILRPVPGSMVRYTVGPDMVARPRWPTPAEVLGDGFRAFEGRGGALFLLLNLVVLGWIWFLVPLLTADCLSRERREGTLGLLLLTPMRPVDLLAAKFGAQFLRAASLFLAAVPILVLPLLVGGVAWETVARWVLIDFAALILALAAGLLASTLWTGPRAVHLGALGLAGSVAAAWLLGGSALEALGGMWNSGGTGRSWMAALGAVLARRSQSVSSMLALAGSGPETLAAVAGWRVRAGAGAVGGAMVWVASAVGLAAGVGWMAWRSLLRLRREGGMRGRSGQVADWIGRERFLQGALAGFRRRVLAREPVLWTEFRSWRLRVGAWLLPLLLVPFLTAWVAEGAYGRAERHEAPVQVFLVFLALSAASALQVERSTGVLELLLTVPAGVAGVVRGKVLALALQVLPGGVLMGGVAGLLFCVAGAGTGGLDSGLRHWGVFGAELAARFILVVGVGLWASVRCRGYLPALAGTLVVVAVGEFVRALAHGLDPSVWMGASVVRPWKETVPGVWGVVAWCLGESAVGLGCLGLLVRWLARRRFVGR